MRLHTAPAVVALGLLLACGGDAGLGIDDVRRSTDIQALAAAKDLVVTSPKYGTQTGVSQVTLVWRFSEQYLLWKIGAASYEWRASECTVEYVDV
jgi:hypothetical protein